MAVRLPGHFSPCFFAQLDFINSHEKESFPSFWSIRSGRFRTRNDLHASTTTLEFDIISLFCACIGIVVCHQVEIRGTNSVLHPFLSVWAALLGIFQLSARSGIFRHTSAGLLRALPPTVKPTPQICYGHTQCLFVEENLTTKSSRKVGSHSDTVGTRQDCLRQYCCWLERMPLAQMLLPLVHSSCHTVGVVVVFDNIIVEG